MMRLDSLAPRTMSLSARRVSTFSSAVAAIMLVFGVVLCLGPGRALEFSTLSLDRHLRVLASEDQAVSEGDRIIMLDDATTRTAREAAWAFPSRSDTGVVAVVETYGPATERTVSRQASAEFLEAMSEGRHRITAVDGQAITPAVELSQASLDEWLVDDEPHTLQVQSVIRMVGPLVARPAETNWLSILWLCLGAAGAVTALLALRRSLHAQAGDSSINGLVVDSAAASALTALATQPLVPPVLEAWAIVAFALSVGFRHGASGGMLQRGLALGPAGLAIVLYGTALTRVSPALAHLASDGILAVAVVVASSFAVMFRSLAQGGSSPDERLTVRVRRTISLLSVVIAALILLVGLLTPGHMHVESAALAGLIVSVGSWGVSAWAHFWETEDSAGGAGLDAVAMLIRATRLTAGRRVSLIRGSAGRYVVVDAVAHVTEPSPGLKAAWTDDSMSLALDMLGVEGEMYPRNLHQLGMEDVGEDPLAGVFDRFGILMVQPLRVNAAGGQAVYLAVWDTASATDPLSFEGFAAWVSRMPWSAAFRETLQIQTVASAQKTASSPASAGTGGGSASTPRAERSSIAPDERGRASAASASMMSSPAMPVGVTQVSGSAAVVSPLEVRSTSDGVTERSSVSPGRSRDASSARSEAWAAVLERTVSSRYDFDNPDVLNEAEWRHLERFAETRLPSLLIGEPGVGKEFIARAIHSLSPGPSGRFGALDCATLSPAVAEVELLGDEETPALLTSLEGGTLLLKSAGHLGQPRVDRILQRARQLDVRLLIAERYQGPPIEMPVTIPTNIRRAVDSRYVMLAPLRERRGEIVRYARVFLHRFAMMYDKAVTELDHDAAVWLTQLELAANFAELEGIIRCAVVRSTGATLLRSDFGLGGASFEADPDDDGAPYSEAEKSAILAALDACDGNRSEAARRLGVTRGKLLRRMKRYGIRT
jgi:hypothetical protein